MKSTTRIQLSLMMFLEFFIWGGWFVTLGTFLGNNLQASGGQTGSVFSTQSWGAIIAPFIIGLIADRYINAERILGALHIIGAILMYQMYNADNVGTFYPYVLAYMILYMPTIALVNSVSFNQMKDPEKEFSSIRVWGTIGWIAAGLLISYGFHWDSQVNIANGLLRNTFLMSSIVSLTLGIFSFTLPKTPPTKSSKEKVTVKEILGFDALKLLNNKNFAIFFISSVLICIPLAFYYQNANAFLSGIGVNNPTGKMTIGQISEVLFLLLLPVFFKKYGFKKTILAGMLAWALRYALFAFGNAGELSFMLLIGIALHGICYDFFFVSGYIYTNSKAGEQYKSAAQGLITLATYGVGMLIGFWIAGLISNNYEIKDGAKHAGIAKDDVILRINNVPVTDSASLSNSLSDLKGGDKVTVVYQRKNEQKSSDVILKTYPPYYKASTAGNNFDKLGIDFDTLSAATATQYNISGGVIVKNLKSSHVWKNIWIIPAIIAAAVLILFSLLFKDEKKQI